MNKVRVKICCISSIEEAKVAINHGADALGLVGHMPSGPGIIEDKLIAKITATIPPAIASFLLTSETKAKDIIHHYSKVNTTTIQLVDSISFEEFPKLRKALPSVRLVQVIHVIDEQSINQAISVSPFVDALLLDSGNPNKKIKELGGTGRTHNWNVSRNIVEQVDIPVFLAGGLNPENIVEAIRYVQPYGVDLCSGVRTDGKLDPIKLELFMNAVKSI